MDETNKSNVEGFFHGLTLFQMREKQIFFNKRFNELANDFFNFLFQDDNWGVKDKVSMNFLASFSEESYLPVSVIGNTTLYTYDIHYDHVNVKAIKRLDNFRLDGNPENFKEWNNSEGFADDHREFAKFLWTRFRSYIDDTKLQFTPSSVEEIEDNNP